MPTTHQRHSITETPDIAVVLDAAARRWPDAAEQRAELIRRILLHDGAALKADFRTKRQRELAAIKRLGGSCTEVFPPDAVEQQRVDWSE